MAPCLRAPNTHTLLPLSYTVPAAPSESQTPLIAQTYTQWWTKTGKQWHEAVYQPTLMLQLETKSNKLWTLQNVADNGGVEFSIAAPYLKKKVLTLTVNGCRVGSGGLLGFELRLQYLERRREGQTGLIRLQRPLKFLLWDINEVIHRKAAARHTNPHHHNPLQPPSPKPPCSSATLPRKGRVVPGEKPVQLPLRAWQLPIDGPGAAGEWAEGWGVQLCVCPHARRGWQQPGIVSYIIRKIMFPQEWAQWFEQWMCRLPSCGESEPGCHL